MRDFDIKIDNTAPAASGRLSAAQFNILADEIKGLVTRALITLDPATGPDSSRVMLGDAIARIASAAHFGIDNGAVNAHVVVSPYGLNGFTMPGALFQGMSIMFRAIATNTGATTVNAFGLGSKPVVDHEGKVLVGGEIVIRRPQMMHFEPSIGSAGAWMLEPWSNAIVVAGAAGGGSVITGGGGGTGKTLRNIYYHTGADQSFTVPTGVTSILVKLWGAGGGGHNPANGYGGCGGYTTAVIPVTAGQVYPIVVGGPGVYGAFGASARPYGYAGIGYANNSFAGDNECWSGGGLTGIFLTSISQANARAIAGGGGGAADGYTYSGLERGANGNDLSHSGNNPTTSTLQGMDGVAGNGSQGGGGGGYHGGGAGPTYGQQRGGGTYYGGEGGSGYAYGSATSVTISASADGTTTPPNTSDADYVAGIGIGGGSGATGDAAGPGLALVYF